MQILVGIGEYKTSSSIDDVLATFALASCVGVVMYSPDRKVMGMAHVMLPDSKINSEDSMNNPGKYADIAVSNLYRELNNKYGVLKTGLHVSVFGGLDSRKNSYFHIGERNVETVLQVLENMGIRRVYRNTGGSRPRTIYGHVSDGRIEMKLVENLNKIS
jgi:chemotaxis protein CheD